MKEKRLGILKYSIYFMMIIFLTLVRWESFSTENSVLTWMFRYNHVFDIGLAFSVIGYFYFNFYNNSFVQTRLDRNGEYDHFKNLFREFITILLLWCSILVLYDTKYFSFEKWKVILSVYLMIITFNFLFFFFHLWLIRREDKYYKVFAVELILLSVHRFYLTDRLNLGSYNFMLSLSKVNYLIVLVNILLIGGLIYVLTNRHYHIEKNLKVINKNYVIYVIAEAFSTYYLLSVVQKKYSYSFFDLFFLTSGEKFTGFIFWLMPKIFIVYVAYKRITDTYHHNLIFYLVRIDDRSRWVRRLILNNMKDALVFTIIKSIITALMYGWNIKIIESGVSYMLLVLLMILIINIIYLLIKKEEVLNYLLIGYLTIATIAVYGGVGMLSWIMLEIKEWTNAWMIVFCVLFYFITVLMLKRDEYYV